MSFLHPPDELTEIDWFELGRVLRRFSECTDITIIGYDESVCRRLGPFAQSKLGVFLDTSGGWVDGYCSRTDSELAYRCIGTGRFEEVVRADAVRIGSLPIRMREQRCGVIIFGWVLNAFPSEHQAQTLARELGLPATDVWRSMRSSLPIADGQFKAIAGLLESFIESVTRQTESRAHAERLVRVRELFLATVSHEIRTPLSSISYRLQALSAALLKDPEKVQEAYSAMTRSVKDLARITEDLVDAARSETGQLTMTPEIVLVSGPIEAAIEAVHPTALMSEISIDFKSEEILIKGDKSRLQQVFWNLLMNAVKFTPSGGEISIVVRLEESFVVVDVKDTGVGIDQAELNLVFNPFHRRAVGNESGLGLGLTISQELVGQHGGRMAIQSAGTGHGTRVSVYLPELLDE